MPNTPTGKLIQNTARQSQAASRPPATRPMNMPASAAIWLVPRAKPRRSGGKASVRIAAELAISIAPPIACRNRHPISHSAPPLPWNGSNDSRIDATVNTTKPWLYIRTRPNMSPSRPRFTTSTACTSR